MFFIIFGTIWTVFSSIFLFAMLAAENLGAPSEGVGIGIAIILLFIGVGITFLVKGFQMILKNRKTAKHGKKAYGIILDILPSGSYVNGRPEMKADVLVHDGFVSDVYSEVIGFDRYKYNINDYLIVKVHEGDINVVEKIDQAHIPANILEKLNEECAKKYNPAFLNNCNTPFVNPIQNIPSNNTFNNQIQNISFNEDTVIINGVEYIRKENNNQENGSENNSDNPFVDSGLNNIHF